MRALARRLGTTLAVLGVLLVVYAAMVVFWRDPVTSIYTAYEQHQMRAELNSAFATWQADAKKMLGTASLSTGTHGGATLTPARSSAAVLRSVRKLALRYAASERGHTGRPLGRIQIKRIDLSSIVVENTDYWGSLSKGPGRYEQGSFPGLGKTTGIAGHRTTFAAPFRHIDSVRNGDSVVVTMPYATFTYRVLRHKVVDNGDWSIMRRVGFDELVLSACHPLYSADQRYVVFARLVNVKLAGASRGVNLPAASAISAA
jgi:sortase A